MKFNVTMVDGTPVLLPPPPGYKVDLENPTQRHNVTAYIVFGIGFPLTTFFFGQYLYVKMRLLRKFDMQLVCLILGWGFSVAMQVIEVENFYEKIVGVHAWEIPVKHSQREAYFILIVTILNAVMTGFCKTSLGLFYVHLSPQAWWKWASWSALFVMAGYNAAIFFAIVFGCSPIEKNWAPSLPGHCINKPKLYIARAALGAVSDFLLLIMPIPMIVGLQMPTRQKLGLILFFAIGSVTFVTAALRCYLLQSTRTSPDFTWTVSSTAVVILAESHLLVICATLPTLRQFFVHMAPHVIGERGSSAKKSQSTGPDFQSHSFKTIGDISNSRKKVDEFGMTVDEEHISLHPMKMDQANHSVNSINTTGSHGVRKKIDKYGMTIYEESLGPEISETPNYAGRHFNTTSSRGTRKRVDKYGMTIYEEGSASEILGIPPSRGNQKRLDEYGLTIHEETFDPHAIGHPEHGHPEHSHPEHGGYSERGYSEYGHSQHGHSQYGHSQYGHSEYGHPDYAHPPHAGHSRGSHRRGPSREAPIYEESRHPDPTRLSNYSNPKTPKTPTSRFNRTYRRKGDAPAMPIHEENYYPPDTNEPPYAHQEPHHGHHEPHHSHQAPPTHCTCGHQPKPDHLAAPAYEESCYLPPRRSEHALRPAKPSLVIRGRANIGKRVDEFGWTKYEDDFYPQTPRSPERERSSQIFRAIDSSFSPREVNGFRMTGDTESFGTFGKQDEDQESIREQQETRPQQSHYPGYHHHGNNHHTNNNHIHIHNNHAHTDRGGATSASSEGNSLAYVQQTSWLDSPSRSSHFDTNFF